VKQEALVTDLGYDVARYKPTKKPKFEFHPLSDLQKRLKIIQDMDPKKLLTKAELGLGYFKSKYDCYRWKLIREGYKRGLITFENVKTIHLEWRNTPESLWLDGYDGNDKFIQTVLVPACKRGNKVYKERVSKKLSYLDALPPIDFFDEAFGRKTTPMLLITLDVDANKYTFDEAWKQQPYELHLFETKLRIAYGSFVKLKASEAHASGYPHKHITYYFPNHEFEVFEHFSVNISCNQCRKRFTKSYTKSKKLNNCKFCGSTDIKKSIPKRTFRVNDAEKQKIKNMWRMGKNLDVQAVQDTLGAFSEIKKYITKTLWNKKGLNTAAALSLFNQKAYYISSCNPVNQYPKLNDNGKRYCNMCGASMDLEYIDNHYFSRNAHCKSCDRQTFVVDFSPSLRNTIAFEDYLKKWRIANMENFRKKDFVGSIWGMDAYKQLYQLHKDGLNEPDQNALVKEILHSCNNEFPEIVYFKYRGTFRTSDINSFLPKAKKKKDPDQHFWLDPSPELRAYFNLVSDLDV